MDIPTTGKLVALVGLALFSAPAWAADAQAPGLWIWMQANSAPLLELAGIVLSLAMPSIVTGLAKHPTALTPLIWRLMLLLCHRLSVATPKDSPGTYKAPFVAAVPPGGQPGSGTGSGPIALVLALLLAGPASAGTLADVAPSTPAPPTRTYGGCSANGLICVAPSVSLSLLAVNLSTKKVEGAFSPGVGVGFTVWPSAWYAAGLDAYFAADPGAQTAVVSVMAKWLSGYLRVGVSKGVIGDLSWRIPVAFGVDL